MMKDSRTADERAAIMAYGQDGIWELVLGVVFVSLAVAEYFVLDYPAAIMVILAYPVVLALKEGITAPRIRLSELSPVASRRLQSAMVFVAVLLLVLALAGLLVFGLLEPQAIPDWLPQATPMALAMVTLVILALTAFAASGSWRYLFYGIVLPASFVLLFWSEIPAWTVFAAPGVLMTVIGLWLLIRFMRSHPPLPPEDRLSFR